MKKITNNISVFLLCLTVFVSGIQVSPANAWIGGFSSRSDGEFGEQQRTNLQVTNALEKAREERAVRNFRRARSFAERALSIDPKNAAAKAFLDNLSREEERWERYLQSQRDLEDKERLRERTRREEERALREEEKARSRAEREAERRAREKERKKVEEPEEKPSIPEPRPERDPGVPDPVIYPDVPHRHDPIIEDDIAKKRSIVVDGDRVEFLQEENRILAEGNVVARYGDVVLTCDRIEIDLASQIALCEGNVRIDDPEHGVLEAEKIRYDLTGELGEITSPGVTAYPWYARADETSKVGPNEYVLINGFFTTCDEDEPHYHVRASEIRIFPDEKVTARNVVYYVGKVPVMWLPYYHQPLVETKSNITVIPGVTSDWGYFLLTSTRFYLKSRTRADIVLDYRTKKGFAYGANLYYEMKDFDMESLGQGLLRAYFIDQHGFGTYSPSEFRDEGTGQDWRNRFQWKHRIDFDERTVGIVELNKVSDKYVLKDYFYNEFAESNPVPRNYVSIVSSTPNYSVSLGANMRLDDFYTVTQRLPEARLNVFNQRLWDTPFFYTSESSATYFEKKYAHAHLPDEKVGRADTFHRFSYVAYAGPLSIVPYATFQGTAYSRTENHADPAFRTVLGGGTEVSSRLHRIYDINTNSLGLDINGIRHIVTPKVHYYYTYRPSMGRGHFYQMDSVDALDHLNGVEVSFSNKLQTRVRYGETTHSVDLLRSTIRGDYSFKEKTEGPRLTTLTSEFEFRPYRWLFFDNRLEIDTENFAIKSNRIEAVTKPWINVKAAIGYNYQKRPIDSRNNLTFDIEWQIDPKWRVGLYERFDLEKRVVREQQLTVTRDLHCWEVSASYRVKGSNLIKDDVSFWLGLRLKAFPDFPIGLSRSYDKKPPGSLSAPSTPSMVVEN